MPMFMKSSEEIAIFARRRAQLHSRLGKAAQYLILFFDNMPQGVEILMHTNLIENFV